MTQINLTTWKEWQEGTITEVFYGVDVNRNFDFVSHMVNKGITDANIATNGIAAGSVIADDVVGERHLNYGNTQDGVRALQIGKNATTITGQMMVWGVSVVTATATTNTDITIYFANAYACTGGDPAFSAAPVVIATCVTAATDWNARVKSVGTTGCVVNVKADGANTFTQNWPVYWVAIGNM